MPLLRVPHKLARAEAVTRADIFDTPCERLISQARVVACLVSLLALHLGPTQLPQNATATNLVLAFYSLFSAGLIGLTCQRLINPVAVWLIHFTDIAIVCLVLLLTDESTSPFFVLFIFVLLAATLRWKWQAVIATAAAPALLLLVASVINGAMSGAVSSNLHTAIIRGAYLITIAGMLAYLGALRERSREQFSRLAYGPARTNRGETAPSLQQILAHSALVLEAPRILVVWEEAEEPYVYWAYWRDGHYQQSHETTGAFGNLVDPSLSNLAFLMADTRSKSLLLSNGPKQINAPAIHTDLVARFSMRGVATAGFAGATCTGRVFILDRSSWNEEHLLLTQIMAYRTGIRLDLLTLQQQSQAASAIRERIRLTRDLHDGILQSLTAAALQLSLLEKTSDLSRLDVVKQLLAKEQRRIREFVDETCPKAVAGNDAVLRLDLQQVVHDTGLHWNCTTSFSIVPDNATVPQALAGQLSLVLAEAIANAGRHGGASKIEVAMTKANGHLDINIRDNGKGFGDPISYEHQEPTSIRERVCALGGSLNVTSSPNGAELVIRVPT